MFFVFNKQKIYAYTISIVTVILLFCVASTLNTNEDTIQTSAENTKLLPIYNVETKEDKNLDSATIYTIQYGDTLWSICDNYYGSPEMIVSVMEINSITDIDKLYVGERIVLPNVENN